jgi:hypothetical protein
MPRTRTSHHHEPALGHRHVAEAHLPRQWLRRTKIATGKRCAGIADRPDAARRGLEPLPVPHVAVELQPARREHQRGQQRHRRQDRICGRIGAGMIGEVAATRPQ